MPLIKSAHDLQPRPDGRAPAVAGGMSFSRYCYLFPDLAAHPAAGCLSGTDEAETLRRLKQFEIAARLPVVPPPALTIPLPAAFTYFGQFVNHDISAPEGSVADAVGVAPPDGIIGNADLPGIEQKRRADCATILAHVVNQYETPLALTSLYADGPGSPDPEVAALYAPDGKRFRLAATSVPPDSAFSDIGIDPARVIHASGAPDIPRQDRVPLIADRRNDGNLILCQMHLAFMLAHNHAVTVLEAQHPDPADCFSAARRLLTRHYHWLILNDFLPRLLSRAVLSRPLADWSPRPHPQGSVPLEFTTAAFRFGHSLVGRLYDFNANFGAGGVIAPGATLMDLFNFTSQNGMAQVGHPAPQLPDHWVIDWSRLTRESEAPSAPAHGRAERIDMNFAPDMLNVAGVASLPEHGSILFRNLLRGFHRRMPFGQRLAIACGIEPLSADQLRAALPRYLSPDGDGSTPVSAAESLGLIAETPAWLYLMCEAEALEQGQRVGPTASTIIADTILGLMRSLADPVFDPSWHPDQSPLRRADGGPVDSLAAFLAWAVGPQIA